MRVDCTGTWWLLAGSLLGLQCKDGKGGDESPAEPPAGIEAIAILPLDGADLKAVDYVAHRLADSFKTKVYVWQPGVMPANAWYAPRKRYWADSVLKWMRPKAAESGLKLMAITGKDIATKMGNKYNWGIMGLSYMPGQVCIVSDYRLHKHGLSDLQLYHRLLKVAMHELGHSEGLPHCEVPVCLMVDAEGQDKLDLRMGFCRRCRGQIFRR